MGQTFSRRRYWLSPNVLYIYSVAKEENSAATSTQAQSRIPPIATKAQQKKEALVVLEQHQALPILIFRCGHNLHNRQAELRKCTRVYSDAHERHIDRTVTAPSALNLHGLHTISVRSLRRSHDNCTKIARFPYNLCAVSPCLPPSALRRNCTVLDENVNTRPQPVTTLRILKNRTENRTSPEANVN